MQIVEYACNGPQRAFLFYCNIDFEQRIRSNNILVLGSQQHIRLIYMYIQPKYSNVTHLYIWLALKVCITYSLSFAVKNFFYVEKTLLEIKFVFFLGKLYINLLLQVNVEIDMTQICICICIQRYLLPGPSKVFEHKSLKYRKCFIIHVQYNVYPISIHTGRSVGRRYV